METFKEGHVVSHDREPLKRIVSGDERRNFFDALLKIRQNRRLVSTLKSLNQSGVVFVQWLKPFQLRLNDGVAQ